jgi:hypothetical protein
MPLTRFRSAIALFLLLTSLLSLGRGQDITTVSMAFNFAHACVNHCLDPGWVLGNLAGALGCAGPVANDCYCGTNSKAASIATSWVNSCAVASCSSGDLSDDSSAMKSAYGSYCQAAGFTQPGMTDWYNPATATTSSPAAPSTGSSAASSASPASSPTVGNSVSTTTSVTVVTHTTTSQPNAGSTNSVSLGKWCLLLGFYAIVGGLLQVHLPSTPCPLAPSRLVKGI